MTDREHPAVVHSQTPTPPLLGEATPPDDDEGGDTHRRFVHRPTIHIRTRITLAFLLVFALCAGIALWSYSALTRIQTKDHFLQVADSYVSEVQQARRFEKNYLLYGTNREDALEHLANAQALLKRNEATVRKVLGAKNLRLLSKHVADYRRLLLQLGHHHQRPRPEVEAELRLHGAQMLSFAMTFARKEREAVDRAFLFARRVPFVFLAVLLVVMLVIVTFLTRQFLSTLARFMEVTRRIGEGDFSPIPPVRKYQDEFSQLAAAFNHMTQELDRRHQILVESHKVRAIGTLVAGVAHELNNPLNNILLTACTLQEERGSMDPAEQEELLADVIGETERSQRIVRNLLDFARESEVKLEPLRLDEIVDNAIRLVGNQVKMAKIKLQVEVARELRPVHGDAQMLCQVFVNLILNAVDALSERGTIQVRVRLAPGGDFVTVEVEDDGAGIPEHVRQRIFEPFFTTKSRGRGTGLGLSVSRGIVRRLGGTIRVQSTVGSGTTFTVLLPTTAIPFETTPGSPTTTGATALPSSPPQTP